MSGGSDDVATLSWLSRFGSVRPERSQLWKEKLEISCRILQWVSSVLCHVSLRWFSEIKWHFRTARFFSGVRSSTNSPSAWGFSFLAIISLTAMKLACVTLSWSARGLDKTACWPIKLGEWQFIQGHLSFQRIQLCMFRAMMTLKVWVFITAKACPQTRHTDLPFTVTKKNSVVYLSLEERHSAPTFLFLLAISRFSKHSSRCCHLSVTEDMTRWDDTRWQLHWCCVQWPWSWPGKTDTCPGGI